MEEILKGVKEGAGAWRRNVMEKVHAGRCQDMRRLRRVLGLRSGFKQALRQLYALLFKSGADYLAIEIDEVIQGTSTDE